MFRKRNGGRISNDWKKSELGVGKQTRKSGAVGVKWIYKIK